MKQHIEYYQFDHYLFYYFQFKFKSRNFIENNN